MLRESHSARPQPSRQVDAPGSLSADPYRGHPCDQVAIIARGKCVTSGRVDDLLRATTTRFTVRAHDPRARDVLSRAGYALDGTTAHNGEILVDVDAAHSHEVTRALADAGIYLSELTPVARTLEDVFLELTEEHE